MAFCGNCGFQNPEGARFCGGCGADLAEQEMGNVETIVNESTGTTTTESNPMAYVPLDASLTEESGLYEGQGAEPTTDAPEPTTDAGVSVASVPPPAPQAPVAPPTPPQASAPAPQPPIAPPAPPQASAPATPPVAPAPQPIIIQTPPPTPQPAPQKGGGSGGNTCLGCGCAAVIVFLLIIGGLCWWVYDYYKKHNRDIDEVLEWVDKGHKEWEETHANGNQDPETMTYNGQTLGELADENGFPTVYYDERPKEGAIYRNDEMGINIRFNYMKFKEGDYIGMMTLSGASSGQMLTFRMSSCGCSIYHLDNPDDGSMEAFAFVYRDAERILVGADGDVQEFKLSEE